MAKRDTCFVTLVALVDDRDAFGVLHDPAEFAQGGDTVALVSFEANPDFDTRYKADTFEEVEAAVRAQLPGYEIDFVRCAA